MKAKGLLDSEAYLATYKRAEGLLVMKNPVEYNKLALSNYALFYSRWDKG